MKCLVILFIIAFIWAAPVSASNIQGRCSLDIYPEACIQEQKAAFSWLSKWVRKNIISKPMNSNYTLFKECSDKATDKLGKDYPALKRCIKSDSV